MNSLVGLRSIWGLNLLFGNLMAAPLLSIHKQLVRDPVINLNSPVLFSPALNLTVEAPPFQPEIPQGNPMEILFEAQPSPEFGTPTQEAEAPESIEDIHFIIAGSMGIAFLFALLALTIACFSQQSAKPLVEDVEDFATNKPAVETTEPSDEVKRQIGQTPSAPIDIPRHPSIIPYPRLPIIGRRVRDPVLSYIDYRDLPDPMFKQLSPFRCDTVDVKLATEQLAEHNIIKATMEPEKITVGFVLSCNKGH